MFKIVVSEPKTKKAWQIEKDIPLLVGKKIGENIDGAAIGLPGFTLQVTGGSDKDGFPMRSDLSGTVRKKVLLSGGTGFKPVKNGMRKKKYVRGNVISEEIVQVNLKVLEGEGDIPTILGVKPKEKPAEAEKPAEQKPEEKKGGEVQQN